MLIAILVLAVLLVCNGFFAMAELAMMTSRQSRLQQAAAKGSQGAGAALALAREPTRFLSTVQVGITLIGILAGAFGERQFAGPLHRLLDRAFPFLGGHTEALALALVVLVITYCSLVLGELVPKRVALAFPEAIAAAIARPLSILSRLAALPVKVLTVSTEAIVAALRLGRASTHDDISQEDVQALISRAAGTGIFSREEHRLFQRLFRAGDLIVRDLMVPRTEIVWIDEDTTVEQMRVLVGTSPYSHFPVCRAGNLDQLSGVVHIKDLIAYGLLAGRDFRVSAVAQKPIFVPETMPALKLLDQFQSSKMHLALIVDEYGGTQGLITLNDVVSALVGDISRRGEQPLAKAVKRDDGSWLVDARLPLHEMAVLLRIPSEAQAALPDVSTVAGLVMARLGHIPTEGERCEWEGWTLEVVDMDGAKIDQVLVRKG